MRCPRSVEVTRQAGDGGYQNRIGDMAHLLELAGTAPPYKDLFDTGGLIAENPRNESMDGARQASIRADSSMSSHPQGVSAAH